MKKICIGMLVMTFGMNAFAASYVDKQLKESKKNVKYQSVQKHTRTINLDDNYELTYKISDGIKDPKLIKLSEVKPIDSNLYQKKLASDEEIYKKEIIPALSKKSNPLDQEPSTVDFYKIYRIAERLIRANNLEYMNWRFAMKKATDDVNASATMANLVTIHTSLYDSLYTNDDALAFVIAHEMSHLLLNHQQRTTELLNRYYNIYGSFNKNAPIVGAAATVHAQKINKEIRMMEYMADTEGFNLLIKAGYNPESALYGLKFLSALPEVKVIIETSDHPHTEDRIKSAKENINLADPNWVDEGKVNIYNSNVLPVKKSSDRVSIVINSDPKIQTFYETESLNKKLTRIAYVSYLKKDMKNAAKYFSKLSKQSDDYVPYLYLSYANEYLYKQTKDEKYKKQALKAIETAFELNSKDENVKNQLNDVKKM